MQLKQMTTPVIAAGGALLRGIFETIALERARRRAAAHDAAARAPAPHSRERKTKH